ncbi:hypothetical protein [Nocardiopsis alba]|uniref:hypothetical protein n=1 Tax=Nocardiopsis alba TaxID=53437 RepID=UPI003D75BE55
MRAAYPKWRITLVDEGPHLGELVATHPDIPGPICSATPERLMLLLKGPELMRLRSAYGDRYWIRTTPNLWIATRRVRDDREPTIIEDTAGDLERRMCEPGRWGQRAPEARRPA